jgi:putative acetyltransferase
MIVIRAALRPADTDGILSVVAEAFADNTRDAREELDIVRGTWAACDAGALLELVADDGGAVVAHALAAGGRLGGADSLVTGVAAVAPVCVAPSHQGRGVGSALMRALVAEAEGRGWRLLLLLGDPEFYARFGFVTAAGFDIHYGPAGIDNPHFQARVLAGGAPLQRGEFSYCWEPASA